MKYFWASIVSFIVISIIFSIIYDKIKKQKLRNLSRQVLPELTDHIQVNKFYNIFLSHGKLIRNVKFLGLSPTYDPNYSFVPFPLCEWLIVEKDDGKRIYIKPNSVRYYEDAADANETT